MERRLALKLLTACSTGVFVLAGMCWTSGVTWSPSSLVGETKPLAVTRHAVSISDGLLVFLRVAPLDVPPPADSADAPSALFVRAGFGSARGLAFAKGSDNNVIGRGVWVFVPLWFVMLLAALLPAGRLVARARAKLVIPPGHCRSCGYDLRASPERCPECGALRGA